MGRYSANPKSNLAGGNLKNLLSSWFLRGSRLFLEIIVHRGVKAQRVTLFPCLAEPCQSL